MAYFDCDWRFIKTMTDLMLNSVKKDFLNNCESVLRNLSAKNMK